MDFRVLVWVNLIVIWCTLLSAADADVLLSEAEMQLPLVYHSVMQAFYANLGKALKAYATYANQDDAPASSSAPPSNEKPTSYVGSQAPAPPLPATSTCDTYAIGWMALFLVVTQLALKLWVSFNVFELGREFSSEINEHDDHDEDPPKTVVVYSKEYYSEE